MHDPHDATSLPTVASFLGRAHNAVIPRARGPRGAAIVEVTKRRGPATHAPMSRTIAARPGSPVVVAASILALVAGCAGGHGGKGGGDDDGVGDSAGTGTDAGDTEDVPAPSGVFADPDALGPTGLRRLSLAELQAALVDLTGLPASEIETMLGVLPGDGSTPDADIGDACECSDPEADFESCSGTDSPCGDLTCYVVFGEGICSQPCTVDNGDDCPVGECTAQVVNGLEVGTWCVP